MTDSISRAFPADQLNKIHPSSHARVALWRMACAGEITPAELYERLAELRAKHGNAIYDHELLPPMPSHLARRQMPKRAA
jgi:hypothetical protein